MPIADRSAPSVDEIAALDAQFSVGDPRQVLTWALERFHPRIALASSFGAEDVVLIDMLCKIESQARIFMLDTLRLHTETYGTVDAIRRRYDADVVAYYPVLEQVDGMAREVGRNCFYESIELRKRCCGIRKVEPLGRALNELDAWITGLRRDQGVTRTDTPVVELDDAHPGLVKLNPLANWTSEQVWAYIREHDVPYNPLHDQGFPSIGCAPCTRAVAPDEDPRAGRWWWEFDPAAKECGIHVAYDADGSPRIAREAGH